MARITTLGIVGKFAIALIAVVVIQGILSFKFRVFGYFDLPLICSVYYGFTLGQPDCFHCDREFARPDAGQPFRRRPRSQRVQQNA